MKDTLASSLTSLQFRLSAGRTDRLPDNALLAELIRRSLGHEMSHSGYLLTSPHGMLVMHDGHYSPNPGSRWILILPFRSKRCVLWRVIVDDDKLRVHPISAVECPAYLRALDSLSVDGGVRTDSYGALTTSGVFMPISKELSGRATLVVTSVHASVLEESGNLLSSLQALTRNTVAVGKGWLTKRFDGMWFQEFTWNGLPIRVCVLDDDSYVPGKLSSYRLPYVVETRSGELSRLINDAGGKVSLGALRLDSNISQVREVLQGKSQGSPYTAIYPDIQGSTGSISLDVGPLSGRAQELLRYWRVYPTTLLKCPFSDVDEIHYIPVDVMASGMRYTTIADGQYGGYSPATLWLDFLTARRGDRFLLPHATGLGVHSLAIWSQNHADSV